MGLQYFLDLNFVSIVLRLIMATICGGVIGLERGRKGQAAGCRTHMLVCIGSALVMMTNVFIVNEYGGASDPSRIGAQVVSGIGFLGAGTIMVTHKNKVKGLTTAAGLWASGCMGLTIGVGYYELAIIGCVFIFSIIAVLNKFDRKIYGASKNIDVYIEFNEAKDLRKLIATLRSMQIEIRDIQIIKNKTIDKSVLGAILSLRTIDKYEHSEIIAELSVLDEISYIEEV